LLIKRHPAVERSSLLFGSRTFFECNVSEIVLSKTAVKEVFRLQEKLQVNEKIANNRESSENNPPHPNCRQEIARFGVSENFLFDEPRQRSAVVVRS
jgi:hypothetical protein